MDLSFSRIDGGVPVAAMPADLAVLLVGIAARQAASPGAQAYVAATRQVRSDWFSPPSGAFHAGVAAALARWREE